MNRIKGCTPGNHDPNAEVTEDMRCSVCGRSLPLDSVAFDKHSTIEHLATILVGKHRAQAIVVQFFDGKWRAGIRRKDGLGPTVNVDNGGPEAAIIKLVHTLEQT